MSDYNVYCIDNAGHIFWRHDYFAPDDAAALNSGRELCGPHDVEVWQGARFVARVAGGGTIGDALQHAPAQTSAGGPF
jgi:hypothetical protein